MSVAYSLKHWRHMFRLYLRMRPWRLEQARLKKKEEIIKLNYNSWNSAIFTTEKQVPFSENSLPFPPNLHTRSCSAKFQDFLPVAGALSVLPWSRIPDIFVTHFAKVCVSLGRWQTEKEAGLCFKSNLKMIKRPNLTNLKKCVKMHKQNKVKQNIHINLQAI